MTSFSHHKGSFHNPLIIAEDSHQLSLFPEQGIFQKRQKPQISCIPGISPKEQNRYRVSLDNKILGDRLSLQQALKLAEDQGGTR